MSVKASFPSSFTIALTTLATYSPTRELLQEVLKSGAIKLGLKNQSSYGSWERNTRIISLNQDSINKGELDSSNQVAVLIFELLNAQSSRAFEALDFKAIRSELTKEEYVTRVEAIEHSNALKCHEYVKKAIKDKVLTRVAISLYFSDFNLHYKFQQITGHSEAIAQRFDQITRCVVRVLYKGTWDPSYQPEDKDLILYLFRLQGNALHNENMEERQRAEILLQKKVEELKIRSLAYEYKAERILLVAQNFLSKK